MAIQPGGGDRTGEPAAAAGAAPVRAPPPAKPPAGAETMPVCDVCGSPDTMWLHCKLICRACHTILMSCGDL